METKLTISQLKNYLGTGLKCKIENSVMGTVIGFKESSQQTGGFEILYFDEFHNATILNKTKPLMYRLQDLDKFIPELGFVPLEIIKGLNLGHCDWITKESKHWVEKYGLEKWLGNIPFAILQKLFEWHFWVFDQEYFTEGLIIDKMTIQITKQELK